MVFDSSNFMQKNIGFWSFWVEISYINLETVGTAQHQPLENKTTERGKADR